MLDWETYRNYLYSGVATNKTYPWLSRGSEASTSVPVPNPKDSWGRGGKPARRRIPPLTLSAVSGCTPEPAVNNGRLGADFVPPPIGRDREEGLGFEGPGGGFVLKIEVRWVSEVLTRGDTLQSNLPPKQFNFSFNLTCTQTKNNLEKIWDQVKSKVKPKIWLHGLKYNHKYPKINSHWARNAFL